MSWRTRVHAIKANEPLGLTSVAVSSALQQRSEPALCADPTPRRGRDASPPTRSTFCSGGTEGCSRPMMALALGPVLPRSTSPSTWPLRREQASQGIPASGYI